MAKLLRSNQTLIENLVVAKSFWSRSKGLLGRSTLPMDEAMWILRCNSIHTLFMNFPIDCVFVNRDLVIEKIFTHVKPWRLIPPVWRASSVIEMTAGQVEKFSLKQGEQLNVVA